MSSTDPYSSNASVSKGDTSNSEPAAHNAMWLLWAGFTAILAAGVGFAIRGGILDNWGREFGFTGAELGVIGGAGFTGFCFGIIIGGVVVDKIGYGKLVIAAFLFHVISALVTFSAVGGTERELAYSLLFWGTFIFAVANGTLEAVANPLVATLFPHNRTHYLNILHASWPAGLIIGGALGWVLDDGLQLDWKIQLALFLLPTLAYGFMFFGQSFPKSEASQKGLSLGQMLGDVGLLGGAVVCLLLALFFSDLFSQLMSPEQGMIAKALGWAVGGVLLLGIGAITKGSVGSPLLFVLFVTHALVGAVELGTDGWIQNITGNILSSGEGKILFVFTSSVMFALRFCADFIEKKLGFSPVAILLVCALLACVGLNLTSRVETFVMAMLALTIYGIGKTFFWPTMLAVASDRFPRTGAIAISIMGGIGMMSAGLIGSPGLGYFKDRYAGEALQVSNPTLFDEYRAEKPSKFLVFPEATGLDSKKMGELSDQIAELEKGQQDASELKGKSDELLAASIAGDRRTLVTDSIIPATMAVIYIALLAYFASIGGYKVLSLSKEEASQA
ncbi:MAG: MFS transporter [Planctomycetales bacterium]|nr:MFS transporter [Planctomycetales bacterium]